MCSRIDLIVARHHHSVVAHHHLLAISCDARADLHAETFRVMSADRFVDGNSRSRQLVGADSKLSHRAD